MALKTNFTDDILSESMNGKRQYNVTENSNGTKSLEDVTDYQSVGNTFSAKDMNETNAAVNQAYDDMGDEFNKNTKYLAGAVKIHNNKLWKFKVDHDPGEWDESQVRKTTLLDEIGELTENLKWTELSAVTGQNTISIPECNEIILEASYDNKRAVLHVPYNIIGANAKTYYIGNSALDFRVSISKTRAMLYGALLNGSTDVLSSTSLQLVYH